MKRTAGLVLAAGESRRMPGRSKLSRSWGDTTVVGAVIRTAREAGLGPVVATVPAGADPPRGAGRADALARLPPRGGRAESLAAGLRACPAGAVVVLLGDEPGMLPGTISGLVQLCEAEDADAGRVEFSDRPGHPVWLGTAARAVAADLRGDASVWSRLVAASLRTVVLRLETGAPIDVDTPEALARARSDAAAAPAAAPAEKPGRAAP
ncbi:MAG: nucleotidyltransferase family protein [Gemmatimonadota bacterium]